MLKDVLDPIAHFDKVVFCRQSSIFVRNKSLFLGGGGFRMDYERIQTPLEDISADRDILHEHF